MDRLSDRSCAACHGDMSPLTREEFTRLHGEVADWQVVDDHHLTRQFLFADFVQALAFVNRVGELAEQEGHHPDLHLAYGKVTVDVWTHKIDGLTESDFILAAKIDTLL